MKVAVLGASPNPERYSNKAIRMLRKHGHDVIPVNPAHRSIEGLDAVPSLDAIDAKATPIDTVTVYVGPAHIDPLIDGIVALNPKRVIMNPGAESPALAERLKREGIEAVEACTLVMLSTGQF